MSAAKTAPKKHAARPADRTISVGTCARCTQPVGVLRGRYACTSCGYTN